VQLRGEPPSPLVALHDALRVGETGGTEGEGGGGGGGVMCHDVKEMLEC